MITFDTPIGATAGGQPVSAEAVFTTSANTVTVVLKDLQANPISVVQDLSELYFTISSGQTAGTLASSSAILRTVNNNGTYVDATSSTSTGWLLTTSGVQLHLNVLGAPAGPSHTILGPPDLAGNQYLAANASIAHVSGPHEPFIGQTATFVLNVSGVTADSSISGAVFSFGTAPGAADVIGTRPPVIVTVPEPTTLALLALGGSLFLAARWRRGLAD
ncbi:MAG: PEP-CTERM sorting domain-containing protein [Phycisphaerae bacterium]|nr:PEP-CTERM sorting domain-containing protein [Phycisphaerae bacterium]